MTERTARLRQVSLDARPTLSAERARLGLERDEGIVLTDVLEDGPAWQVLTHAGRRVGRPDAVAWAREVAERGAGEIAPPVSPRVLADQPEDRAGNRTRACAPCVRAARSAPTTSQR